MVLLLVCVISVAPLSSASSEVPRPARGRAPAGYGRIMRKYIELPSIYIFIKNARCGQSLALFEWDFHISCTGVLFRVTGLTEIPLN